jgi:hypothetical protein
MPVIKGMDLHMVGDNEHSAPEDPVYRVINGFGNVVYIQTASRLYIQVDRLVTSDGLRLDYIPGDALNPSSIAAGRRNSPPTPAEVSALVAAVHKYAGVEYVASGHRCGWLTNKDDPNYYYIVDIFWNPMPRLSVV